ncbi:3-hydroxyacyl-CoA dehydrogenase NAD-binding domain-containing protein [Niveispirillum sp. BGYR6]|uniref:3-hydroxyacyl-CoA dehydrogenase NAD-binding domain-containing protein n=1 Tax=Niveispirillum sp. BGYR6 TaxID=2971249 RepID=UPI0022B9BE48|nr:3-hydroxyacyl-CoA dehydrogenase NAD-binding domain-containing protein [Niveispirillum sp. BGYR6]MDG5497526.1 3-hydroxyacyl-CoA dehydrogenase NAD-binding domain-containing protein [Niveispirillum sp. BGYR6]
MPERDVALLGCGLIGQSWAALLLAHGINVSAWDPDGDALAALPRHVLPMLDQLRALGVAAAEPGQIRLAATVEAAVADADWVQENAPENVALKQRLYAQVQAAAPADAVIASSTSSLTWSALATGMARPGRLVTAHPFNPPHLMPLVEIYGTEAAVVDRAVRFYQALGRETVVLKKEATGHIANRLASALWREAVHIVAAGIADVADVDRALVHGPGLRWSVIGAHLAYHLGGGAGGIGHYLQHLGPSQERRWASLGQPRLTPEICQQLVEGIAQEAAGRSIATLEQQRDQGLIAALTARQQLSAGDDHAV